MIPHNDKDPKWERKHESYCWEGHANVHKGCKCGCHNDKEMTVEARARSVIFDNFLIHLDLRNGCRKESILQEQFPKLQEVICEAIKQAEQAAYERGLEDAAKVADDILGAGDMVAKEIRALKSSPAAQSKGK